eukprot:g14257.t1
MTTSDSGVGKYLGISPLIQTTERKQIDTNYGPLNITIEGKLEQWVIFTYHDAGLDHTSCFDSFFNFARSANPIFQKLAVVHIDAPGQTAGASEIPDSVPYLDMEELTEQVEVVRKELKLKSFIGMGIGAGAYIMANYG